MTAKMEGSLHPDQGAQSRHGGWPNPRDPVQVSDPYERPVPFAIGHDFPGPGWPDARQPLELRRGGGVDVEQDRRCSRGKRPDGG